MGEVEEAQVLVSSFKIYCGRDLELSASVISAALFAVTKVVRRTKVMHMNAFGFRQAL